MQINKISKGSIGMFYNNLDLVPMQQYLSYKNVNKMKTLLIKLLYSKVTL